MKAFKTIPFLRILVPFLCGIVWTIYLPSLTVRSPLLILAGSVFLVVSYFTLGEKKNYKWAFFLTADLLLVLLGSYLTYSQNDLTNTSSYTRWIRDNSENTLLVQVDDIPVRKEKFTRFSLKVLGIKDSTGVRNVNGHVYGYFRNGVSATSLQPGTVIVLSAKLQELEAPQNPFEFDYKNYLFYKNIHHTVFADSTQYQVIRLESGLNPIWSFGLKCKGDVLASLRASGLSPDAFSICSALLTGYDDEINKSVMDSFSHSGTLHVLSVSGLHVGLIYLIFNFLFDRLDPNNRYKLSRFLVISACLWGFALITGFSAPVLRSVIMFTLLGIGKIYYRHQRLNQLNILLASAFILLVWNPFFIMDIGFLLSYLALFGLMYFQPMLAANWQPGSPILKYLWESTCASFAATISTLSVTLFCFKQFPLWFFICNIVVVPATFLLMLLAMLVLFKLTGVSILINWLINTLIWFISLFNAGGLGYIDNIHFTFSDSIFLSALIFLISIAIQYRSYIYLRNAFLVMIFWQIAAIYTSYLSKSAVEFTAYKLQREDGFSLKNGQDVTLTEVNKRNFDFHIKPDLNSFNYPKVESRNFNYLERAGRGILLVGKNQSLRIADPGKVRTLVLLQNSRPKEAELTTLTNLELIVSGGSNSEKSVAYAEELSRKFKLGFYSVKRSGCFKTDMN